jgi:hypothetical protein
VKYDPLVVNGAVLEQVAKSNKCTLMRPGEVRPDATPKYYLSNSKYKNVPMLEIQKCRVNSALAEGQDPDGFLSPRQLMKVGKS